jgi:hypothetical protein
MHLITDAACALGSRFNIIFDPHDHCLYQNAWGSFREQRLELTAGIRTPAGEVWALPFTSTAQHFPFVEQFITPTKIAYRAIHPALAVEFLMTVRMPFYPQNAMLSTAPVYYVDLEVRPVGKFRWERPADPLQAGEIVFELAGEGAEFAEAESGFSYAFDSTAPFRMEGDPVTVEVGNWIESAGAERSGPSALSRPFDLSGGEGETLGLLWSSWAAGPVMEVFDEKTPFKYKQFFKSREQMAAWALKERADIEARCDLLDAAIEDWSLGVAASHMAALSLHSFLACSWWTTRKDGRDWFSVWEGSCYYHSTIDVEYNDALLYFAVWPQLLGMLLEEWADFEMDGEEVLGAEGKGSTFLCHDMGSDHMVGRQVYQHHMELEENANYLLLLAAWTSFTGNLAAAKKLIPLCRRLAEFVVASDSTGNGVPDKATANTIDDASPAVQFGREQVYLAIKCQAAMWALAELEQRCEAKGWQAQAERWRAFASKGVKTIEEEAWLDDHYAVTLTRTTEGLVDPWDGTPLPEGELEGWDDYSIYTANGLLYLFLGGMKMPRWRLNRLAADIESADRRTMTPYGGRHASGSDHTVWFSQNMWRDYVGAYLGVDLLNNVERYWDYQAATGDNWCSSLYYDTTDHNNLNFYPRGTTVFGMPMAAAGLRLDRLAGQLALQPLRATLRVPLLPLADWEGMRIPMLEVLHREGVAIARITNDDLLEGLAVSVTGAEREPE